ncbi:HARB1 nuclease, partial [Amia calva]|nr:HARB1 nuclease [Amia calva]
MTLSPSSSAKNLGVTLDLQHSAHHHADTHLPILPKQHMLNLVFLLDILVFSMPRLAHATPLLQYLHWLPIPARIQFKTLTLTYHCLDQTTLSYHQSLISPYIPSRLLRSSYVRRLTLPPLHSPSSRARSFSFLMPNTIGVIDCTHVHIQAPHEKEWEFVNRKGWHCINVQLVGDADLIITNCVVRWPGSMHDAQICISCMYM